MQGIKRAPDWRKPATYEQLFFQKKPFYGMNEEIRCITKKGKTPTNEWENDNILRAL